MAPQGIIRRSFKAIFGLKKPESSFVFVALKFSLSLRAFAPPPPPPLLQCKRVFCHYVILRLLDICCHVCAAKLDFLKLLRRICCSLCPARVRFFFRMSSQMALTFSIVGKEVLPRHATQIRVHILPCKLSAMHHLPTCLCVSSAHVPSFKDAPLYEYVINARQGGQANDTAHMFQFIVHASLDVYAYPPPPSPSNTSRTTVLRLNPPTPHPSFSFFPCSIDETLWTSSNMFVIFVLLFFLK